MNALKALNRFYSKSYEKAPFKTLCVTNGCLAVVSDVTAQTITYVNWKRSVENKATNLDERLPPRLQEHEDLKPRPPRMFDPYRTLRFALYNMAVAPIVGRWFMFLEARFPMPAVAQATKSLIKPSDMVTLKRMVTDQALFAPMSLCLFFSVMGFVETKSVEGVKEKFRDAYSPALKANYQLWPLVQLVNFKFTPLPYRLPVVSTVGIAWNSYLSWLNNASKEEEIATQKFEKAERQYDGTRGEQIKLEI
jgi:protein Mpv17